MISIIIPALNEPYLEELKFHIGINLKDWYEYEVLIQEEKGLTNAILQGVKRAKGDVIVVMDGDGSHSPNYLCPMIEQVLFKDYDIVVGSRYVKNGRSSDSFARRLISRIYCFTAQNVLNVSIKDNMSGFIVARKKLFDELSIVKGNDYKFGLELIARNKHRVREYPILFDKRKMGKSKVNILQGLRTMWLVLKIEVILIFSGI